jgi:hypothetical protein
MPALAKHGDPRIICFVPGKPGDGRDRASPIGRFGMIYAAADRPTSCAPAQRITASGGPTFRSKTDRCGGVIAALATNNRHRTGLTLFLTDSTFAINPNLLADFRWIQLAILPLTLFAFPSSLVGGSQSTGR